MFCFWFLSSIFSYLVFGNFKIIIYGVGVFHPFLWVVPGPFQLRFRSFSSGKLWYYLIIPPLFFCLSGTFINQTEDLLNQFCNFLMFPVSPNFIFQPSIVQYCVFNFQEYSFFIASCSSFIDSLPSFIYYKIFLGFLNVSSEFAFSASFGLSVIAFLVAQSVKDQSAMLETACKAGDAGSIPLLGRSYGEGNGNSLQYSWLGNPMDRGVWWTTVHGVVMS